MDEVVDKDVEMGCEVVGVLMELVLVCYITIYLQMFSNLIKCCFDIVQFIFNAETIADTEQFGQMLLFEDSKFRNGCAGECVGRLMKYCFVI